MERLGEYPREDDWLDAAAEADEKADEPGAVNFNEVKLNFQNLSRSILI